MVKGVTGFFLFVDEEVPSWDRVCAPSLGFGKFLGETPVAELAFDCVHCLVGVFRFRTDLLCAKELSVRYVFKLFGGGWGGRSRDGGRHYGRWVW